MPEVGDSIRVYFPTCDEKEGYVITKHDSHMPASEATAGGSSGKSSSGGHKASGGRSSSGGSSASGDGSGDGGEPAGGGAASGVGGGVAAGASVAGTPTAGASTGAPKEEEKKQESDKEDPMDDPSKRNIFTQDGCVVQMVPQGVILTAGNSTLMLKKTGEIVMDAPQGISVYAGKKLTMSARKITVKAGSFIELKDESGADIAIRKQHIKMHGQEIYEN